LGSLRLPVRAVRTAHVRPLVPVDAQPSQRLDHPVHRLLGDPARVRVLDPEDERAAVVPGEGPAEQAGPDVAHMQRARRRGRETRADGDHRPATGLASTPIPSTSTSTRSPGDKGPTPSGVPVRITSPGRRVMKLVTNSISVATPKTMSAVVARWRVSPFTRVSTNASFGSSSVSIHGPRGHEPSNPLARVHW